MEKEFVTYEIALQLKELGFDEPCFGFYWLSGKLNNNLSKNTNTKLIQDSTTIAQGLQDGNFCSAPLYQQAFRWFREKYELEGVPQRAEDFVWYKWTIYQYNENGKEYVAAWHEYKTYEEAELACLIKLIEIVENKTK